MKHRNLIAIAVAAALAAPLAGFAQSDSTAVTVKPGRTDSSATGEQRTNESMPQHPAGGDSGRMRSQRMDDRAPAVPEIAPYSPSPVGRSRELEIQEVSPAPINAVTGSGDVVPTSPSPVGRSRQQEPSLPAARSDLPSSSDTTSSTSQTSGGSSGTAQTPSDPSANPSAPPGRAGDVTPRSDSPVGRPAGQSTDQPGGDKAQPAAEGPPAVRSGDVAPGNRTPGGRTPSEPQPESSKGSQTPPSR